MKACYYSPQPPLLDPKRARIRVPLFTQKGVVLRKERDSRFCKKGYLFSAEIRDFNTDIGRNIVVDESDSGRERRKITYDFQ